MTILIGSNLPPLSGPFDSNGVDHHIFHRLVLRTFLHLGNLVSYILSFHYFAKDCVIAGEPRRGRHGDKELAAIGSRAGIGHSELAGFIELVRRAFGFIPELVAWAAHAGAAGIA